MENNQTPSAADEQQTAAPGAVKEQPQRPPIDAERIADALMTSLDTRQQQAERLVVASFARQNNMTVEEVNDLLAAHRKQQQDVIPAAVQARIDERMKAADNRLISAEVKAIGSELHLIDIDAAFALMDRSGISVGEDGAVTGVKEALEALAQAKPWLVKSSAPAGTGRAGNFPRSDAAGTADYARRLQEARQSGNHTLATAIISEAAAKGITLR